MSRTPPRAAPVDLAGIVPLGQISNHAAEKDLITVQKALLGTVPRRAQPWLAAALARFAPSGLV